MQREQKHREEVSSLMDGETEADELDSILTKLKEDEARNDWETYHRIGEVLRSSDIGPELSSGFFGKLQARLEQEPAHGKEGAKPDVARNADESIKEGKHPDASTSRWVLSGIIASAAASTALIMAPQVETAPAASMGMLSSLPGGRTGDASERPTQAARIGAEQAAETGAEFVRSRQPADPLDGTLIAWHDNLQPGAKK